MQQHTTSAPRSGLADVLETLTWRDPSSAPSGLRLCYEDMLERELRSLSGDNDDALCVLEAAELLPGEHRRAFLRAPLVASRLIACRKGEPFRAEPIVKSLIAELAIAGIDSEVFEPVWTALGDRCVLPAEGAPTISPGAVVAGTDIVVDAGGPIDFSRRDGARLVAPRRGEADAALANVNAASEGISLASMSAVDCWRESVDVLALRTSEDCQESFSSVSLAYNARVTLLINAHVRELTHTAMADALLHEAIHALIFMHETIDGPLVSEQGRDIQIASPWSGKPLFLSAFAHACLVWYGLSCFWKLALNQQHWPAPECRLFLDRARVGFGRRPFTSLRPDARRQISDDAAAVLAEVEARMTTA